MLKLWTVVFFALLPHQRRGPVFTPDREKMDLGTLAYASDGVGEFWFTNTGDEPLLIVNCRTSCGCLVPYYSTDPVMPGKRDKIVFKYDASREGVISKTFTVTVNEVAATDNDGRVIYASHTYAVVGRVEPAPVRGFYLGEKWVETPEKE